MGNCALGFLEPLRFPIEPGILVTDSVVYVGWQQLSEDFLNVGYDVNRNSLEKVFLNITGGWFNPGASIIPGSLMIRAVFGMEDIVTHTEEPVGDGTEIVIHPNPASDLIHIRTAGFEAERLSILDGLGRPVYSGSFPPAEIDVSRYPEGIYYVRIAGSKGELIYRKVIISH